jgi:N-acetylmuramoyl-L-alanine amidase CwlA
MVLKEPASAGSGYPQFEQIPYNTFPGRMPAPASRGNGGQLQRGEVPRKIDSLRRERIMQLDQAFAELNIVQDFIPVGNSNRPGTKLTPTSITIHNTDNANKGANAAAHAKYQKGADARKRKVSWHFTVDDKSVYQSLPTNEIGWHAGKFKNERTSKGNATSIGIEICMNADLDVPAAYRRAALLTAVLAFQNKITVSSQVFQHNHWSGKNCPRILRAKPNGWKDFLDQVKQFRDDLTDVPAPTIAIPKGDDHHLA